MQGNSRIAFANTLRGFAALAVVISHYFGVFWLNRAAVETITNAPALPLNTHTTPEYIFWLHFSPIFNWGAYGVALFFIISGFVIPFSLQKTNWLGFLAARILRIIPTYLLGFSITLAAILICTKYFSREWPFSTKEVIIHYIPGIRDILWSRSIDGIVWTLEIEMKFYFVCTLLTIWFRQQSLKVFIAPIALFALAFYLNRLIPTWNHTDPAAWQLATTYVTASQYIIYMFIGVLFHYLYRGKIDANKAYFGIGGLFAIFCIHWWAGPNSASFGTAWSYAFALLTFAFAYSFPYYFRSNRIFDFFAKISYPLYVIHGVTGYAALRIMLDQGLTAWLALAIVTALCIFFSWVIHLLIESPTQTLGKKIAAKLVSISIKPTSSI